MYTKILYTIDKQFYDQLQDTHIRILYSHIIVTYHNERVIENGHIIAVRVVVVVVAIKTGHPYRYIVGSSEVRNPVAILRTWVCHWFIATPRHAGRDDDVMPFRNIPARARFPLVIPRTNLLPKQVKNGRLTHTAAAAHKATVTRSRR